MNYPRIYLNFFDDSSTFFKVILEAEPVKFSELVIEDRLEHIEEAVRHSDVVKDIAIVPSLPDLTWKTVHAKTLRGIGDGAIGDDAFKLAPIELTNKKKTLTPLPLPLE